MMRVAVSLVGLLLVSLANAGDSSSKTMFKDRWAFFPDLSFSGLSSKNGIDLLSLTKNFSEHFQLLSVRYREDKNEIRLIYGNELARQGLKLPKRTYQNGAVFYKVVYPAIRDSAFKPSLVPAEQAGARQIMLYDKEKYKKYGGWTYAVFDREKGSLPGDPEATINACYACHKIVESRNYVFSTVMRDIDPWVASEAAKQEAPPSHSEDQFQKVFSFHTGAIQNVHPEIVRRLGPGHPQVELLDGELMKSGFTGFIPEIGYQLIDHAEKTDRPTLSVMEKGQIVIFAYAFRDDDTAHYCGKTEHLFRYGSGRISKEPRERNAFREYWTCK
jgi:hypothetical protein